MDSLEGHLQVGPSEVADDVSSVVGFFEDYLLELWVWFYSGSGHGGL